MRLPVLVSLLGLGGGCGRIGFESMGSDVGDASLDSGSLDSGSLDSGILVGCSLRLEMEEAVWTGAAGEVGDSCGANHGTATNGAIAVTDPTRGRVGKFVGGTSCVTVPDAPSLRMSSALTASAWIRPNILSPNSFGVISKRRSFGSGSEYSVFVWASAAGTGPTNHLYVDIADESDRIDDPNTDYPDSWRQITVVYDGTLPTDQRTMFYVDGTIAFVAPAQEASIPVPASPADLAIGCLPLDGPAQSMVGLIDEVVLWSRALSATEVSSWYLATRR